MDDGNNNTGNKGSGTWQIVFILAVLIIDYATILRIEIFDEMNNGRSALDAVTQGNLVLTSIGIIISVLGFAWIFYIVQKAVNRHPG